MLRCLSRCYPESRQDCAYGGPYAPSKRAWRMWSEAPYRNSWDIAKALKVSEPVALRLLELARRDGNVN